MYSLHTAIIRAIDDTTFHCGREDDTTRKHLKIAFRCVKEGFTLNHNKSAVLTSFIDRLYRTFSANDERSPEEAAEERRNSGLDLYYEARQVAYDDTAAAFIGHHLQYYYIDTAHGGGGDDGSREFMLRIPVCVRTLPIPVPVRETRVFYAERGEFTRMTYVPSPNQRVWDRYRFTLRMTRIAKDELDKFLAVNHVFDAYARRIDFKSQAFRLLAAYALDQM